MKLSAVSGVVKGKRVVMVDDSIVRGTTSRRIVQLLKEAGATEVHVAIGSPALAYPCFYGIDIQTRQELIAANHTVEETRQIIGADSMTYLSIDGLIESIGIETDAPNGGLCVAYFDGDYPTPLYDYEEDYRRSLEEKTSFLQVGDRFSIKEKEKQMTNKNAYAQSGVDVEAGYEVVERIKSTWPVRSVQVSWELLVALVVCLTFPRLGLKNPS